MGCDIHGTLERKVGDKWVMVERLRGVATDRHYHRFGALAGVRRDGPALKGVPTDVSDSTQLYITEWAGDGHSHSWWSMVDFVKICMDTDDTTTKSDYDNAYPFDYYLNLDDYRVVFWFDN